MTKVYSDRVFYENVLGNILSTPISISYSTKHIQTYLHSRSNSLTSRNSFVPFVNERDATGKLLKKDQTKSNPVITKKHASSQEILSKKSNYSNLSNTRNVAFLSAVQPNKSRIKRNRYPSPPVGLYHPQETESTRNTKRTSFMKGNSDSSNTQYVRVASLDRVDHETGNKNLTRRVQGFSMSKQIARNKPEDCKYDDWQKPKVILPEHLSKYKGMYHQSGFAQLSIEKFPKKFMEISKKQEDLIKQKLTELREMEMSLKKKSNWYKH